MPNFERGVYEPSDEVRVFDGSEEDDDMEGSRLPLLIVLALLVLAMFAGLVWLAYTQGVARGRSETPVIAAAAGPVRVAPQTPGGADQTYKGFKIYEQPAPPDEDADAAPSPPATPAVTAPAADAAKPVPVADAAKPAPAADAAKPDTAKPVAQAVLKPVVPAAAAKPVIVASKPVAAPALPKPAAQAVTPPPAMKKAVLAPTPAATGAPHPLGLAAAPAPLTGGGFVLQIGAYKSQGDADTAWKAYKAKHAALLAGYSDNVQQADLGDKGTWYRLRVAGFSDRDIAMGLCDRLKADGAACILGK